MNDNVKILYHNKRDNNFPYCANVNEWKGLEAEGQVASGVLVIQGCKHLVVAPTGSKTNLSWSTAAVSGGGTTTTDRIDALNDFNGKKNTAEQIKHSECSPKDKAPGFCATYERPNANGKGLTAGKWWLPSVGEMMMIFANIKKINAALAVISGAEQLSEDWYWTSTEGTAEYAWYFFLKNGAFRYIYYKESGVNR